jgi:hypothetical protein
MLLAFWMVTIFAERLIVDLATIKYVSPLRTHLRKEIRHNTTWRTLVRQAFEDRTVYMFLLPAYPLLVGAILLNRHRGEFFIGVLKNAMLAIVDLIRGHIVELAILLVVSFLVSLYRKPRYSKSIVDIAKKRCEEAWKRMKESTPLVFILIGLFLIKAILQMLAAGVGEDPRIREIVQGWTVASWLVVANTLLYFVIYRWCIKKYVAAGDRSWFWAGFFKDTAIYTLAVLFMASALDRFRYALPYLAPRDRWLTYALFAVPTLFVAIIGVAMDLWYVRHQLGNEYQARGARAVMHFHIYFRFIVLFSMPLLLWFGYLAVQVANAAQTHM